MTTTIPSVARSVPDGRPFRSTSTLRFLLDPRFRSDPYPLYDGLRDHERVHHAPLGITLISGYDECLSILKNPLVSSDQRHADLRFAAGRGGAGIIAEAPGRLMFQLADRHSRGRGEGAFVRLAQQLLITLDPPDHTRIRALASRAFTPRVVEQMRPSIEALAHRLLDEVADDGGTDLLAAYCYRFPVTVICELLGVPSEDHARFSAWVPDLVAGLDATAVASHTLRRRADLAVVRLSRYLEQLIRRLRTDPDDRLLSALIAASDGDDYLTETELVAFAGLLLVAGHETTANLVGNGLWHLWRHADQFHRWRTEAEIRPNGVDELLRYDTPVQLATRCATEPMDVGGTSLPAGRILALMIGAANRDPQRFTEPAQLDLERREGPPLSFGFGIHHCLGASLARTEAEVALSVLFDRFPRLRIVLEQPRWKPTLVFRGLRELPVRWS